MLANRKDTAGQDALDLDLCPFATAVTKKEQEHADILVGQDGEPSPDEAAPKGIAEEVGHDGTEHPDGDKRDHRHIGHIPRATQRPDVVT